MKILLSVDRNISECPLIAHECSLKSASSIYDSLTHVVNNNQIFVDVAVTVSSLAVLQRRQHNVTLSSYHMASYATIHFCVKEHLLKSSYTGTHRTSLSWSNPTNALNFRNSVMFLRRIGYIQSL